MTGDSLRDAVAADLRAVRPLPSPIWRTGWLVPIALVLLFGTAAVFGVRRDAPRLGGMLTWGASASEMVLALGLVSVALREAVPGTTLSRRALTLAFGAAAGAVAAISWITWSTSPIALMRDPGAVVWRICAGGMIAGATPPLLLTTWLVARAFPLRPALAGALSGLAAGLMADAGWRVFCHFSNPAHVFGAHIAAVAVMTLAGSLLVRRVAPGPRTITNH